MMSPHHQAEFGMTQSWIEIGREREGEVRGGEREREREREGVREGGGEIGKSASASEYRCSV